MSTTTAAGLLSQGLQSELAKIQALVVLITSPETELAARMHLVDVRLAAKNLTAAIANMKAPHQEEIKKIDAAAKPWKDILASRSQMLNQGLISYGNQVREAAAAANAKLLSKYEAKVERATEKAIESGKSVPLIIPPTLTSTPPKSVSIDGATMTTVKRKAWRLKPAMRIPYTGEPEDLSAHDASECGLSIPLDYFVLDIARIGRVIRGGGVIPGIEVYEEESISIRKT